MSEGQLNHLTNLCHLLAAATNVIVANLLGIVLVVSVDGFSLIEQSSGGSDNAILARVHIHDLELDGAETSSHHEGVALLDGAVAVLEVRDEVSLGEVSSDSFDRVSEGEHVDLGRVGNIVGHWVNRADVTNAHAQVASDDLVHEDLVVLGIGTLVGQSNAHSLLSLLS